MYIEAVPNRNSPPAILLRESYRQGGKVRKRTLCNLSDWLPAHVEGLRGVLKGGTVIPPEHDAITVTRSLPHGHVAAALGMARKIGLDRILGPDANRCRDLVLALLIGRILDPVSKLAAARTLSPATASSSLGEVLGLGEGNRGKTAGTDARSASGCHVCRQGRRGRVLCLTAAAPGGWPE